MSREGINSVSIRTHGNILFGAGTVHKNLTYTAVSYSHTSDNSVNGTKTYYVRTGTSPSYSYSKVENPVTSDINSYYEKSGGWNFASSVMGATSGGSGIKIIPTIIKIPVDGVNVNMKNLVKKVGEKAEMTVNFTELSNELIKSAVIGKNGESEDGASDVIISKSEITAGDYYDNIAFVGKTLDDRNIIVIMKNCLCTQGFSFKTKSGDGMTAELKFECFADDESDGCSLPYKIYYPEEM